MSKHDAEIREFLAQEPGRWRTVTEIHEQTSSSARNVITQCLKRMADDGELDRDKANKRKLLYRLGHGRAPLVKDLPMDDDRSVAFVVDGRWMDDDDVAAMKELSARHVRAVQFPRSIRIYEASQVPPVLSCGSCEGKGWVEVAEEHIGEPMDCPECGTREDLIDEIELLRSALADLLEAAADGAIGRDKTGALVWGQWGGRLSRFELEQVRDGDNQIVPDNFVWKARLSPEGRTRVPRVPFVIISDR